MPKKSQSTKVEDLKVKAAGWNPEGGGLFAARDLGALFLLLVPPVFVIIMWHTIYALDGSFVELFN